MIVTKETVGARQVVEHADVVGDDHLEGFAGARAGEEVAVALDGHGDRRLVDPIGAIAHASASPARSEGQDLPERIEEQGDVVVAQMPLESLRIGVGQLAREPAAQPLGSPPAELGVGLDEALTGPIQI